MCMMYQLQLNQINYKQGTKNFVMVLKLFLLINTIDKESFDFEYILDSSFIQNLIRPHLQDIRYRLFM